MVLSISIANGTAPSSCLWIMILPSSTAYCQYPFFEVSPLLTAVLVKIGRPLIKIATVITILLRLCYTDVKANGAAVALCARIMESYSFAIVSVLVHMITSTGKSLHGQSGSLRSLCYFCHVWSPLLLSYYGYEVITLFFSYIIYNSLHYKESFFKKKCRKYEFLRYGWFLLLKS